MDHATMNHESVTMDTPATTTVSPAAATAATSMGMEGMDHGGMDHGGSMGGCKISMLWNWNTIDSCFISSSWHVTSSGMFAGSCIGTVLLVVALEFLRRAIKEYDAFLIRQHRAGLAGRDANSHAAAVSADHPKTTVTASSSVPDSASSQEMVVGIAEDSGFRPNVFQQAVRALLHMLQFAVAYFVMLLAMYYNGYIIICIFIGAYIGAFIFHWEKLGSGAGKTSASKEATVCCG